jgi:hypothetical protein
LTTTFVSPKGKKTEKLSCISTPKLIEKNQRETKKREEKERGRDRERDKEYHIIVKAQKGNVKLTFWRTNLSSVSSLWLL